MTEEEIHKEAVKRTRAAGFKPCACAAPKCHVTLEHKRLVKAFERAIRLGITTGYNQATDEAAEQDAGADL